MRKLLVWDGDNTLWEGTLLEGDRVELPEGRLTQLQELENRGVLQAIASRNLQEDVWKCLHTFGVAQFFLSIKADMSTPKSDMIKSIMAELGLVKNSDVVFLDDEPFNCREVESLLLGTLAFPPYTCEKVIRAYFEKSSYTLEDRNRVSSYRAEIERQNNAKAYGEDYQKFLSQCGITLSLRIPLFEDMNRVIDLIRRSNQFSVVADQYSDNQLLQAREEIIVGAVSDRYGTYGLSSVLWAHKGEIRILVISCRLQNKGIGSAILGWLINNSIGSKIWTKFRETPYNSSMKNLFDWYGFRLKNGLYSIIPNSEVSLPDWVNVE